MSVNVLRRKRNGFSQLMKWRQIVLKTSVLGAAVLLLSSYGATAQNAKTVLRSCKPDMAKFCSEVAPGNGRIKACMKEHLHELSDPCKEALFQAWLRY
jgi:hypothetical protein